jgi:hypothetical protein
LPRPFDVALFDNDPVLEEISAFADSLLDGALRAAIKNNLLSRYRRTQPSRVRVLYTSASHPLILVKVPSSSTTWHVLVHWIRRDDKTDILEYDLPKDATLQQLLDKICKQIREKARSKPNEGFVPRD